MKLRKGKNIIELENKGHIAAFKEAGYIEIKETLKAKKDGSDIPKEKGAAE